MRAPNSQTLFGPAIAVLLAAGISAPAEPPSVPVPGIEPGETLSEQLDEDKGVIDPPPTGDEDIYTDVPNPEAGHEEEVIPPPGTPGGDSTIEPK